MRVLVTGATGFIGSNAARHLVRAGHAVRALVRPESDLDALAGIGAEPVIGNLADVQALEEAVRGCDAVVHAAELVRAHSDGEMLDVNGAGTGRLVQAALRVCPGLRRFVYLSSLAAVGPGGADFQPVREDDHPRPVSFYGKSKRIGEDLVLRAASRLPVTIIRPPVVYGPGDREVLRLFRLVKHHVVPMPGPVRAKLSVVFVEDLCRAIQDALERDHPSGSVFFVEDGVAWTWASLGEAVAGALAVRARRIRLPAWTFSLASRANVAKRRLRRHPVLLTPDRIAEIRHANWLCSSRAIRERLSWEPRTPFTEGARLTANWYRDRGWL